MLAKEELVKLYIDEKRSTKEISVIKKCSESGVNYWIQKYSIQKRDISESLYAKRNPLGDPFIMPKIIPRDFITGLGMGIFWGEGTKKSKNSVRLGNSDPKLINAFVYFLKNVFKVQEDKIKFGIQIFDNMNKDEVLRYWMRHLGVGKNKFHKSIVVSKSGKKGSYKEKNFYGVVTVYFNNMKLKKVFDSYLEDIRKMY